MKVIPLWSKEAQKKLIDMGMTKKQLAQEIHVNYNQLCDVMSGRVINDSIMFSVCSYLEIETE